MIDRPRTVDSGLAGGLNLIRLLPRHGETQPGRNPSAGYVGFVVVDLDPVDARNVERRVGERRSQFGGQPLSNVVDMDPVADLENVRPPTAMQAASTDRHLAQERAVDRVASLPPVVVPAGDEVASVGHGQRFLGDLEQMLEHLLPEYEDEGKSYLTVAFGCTGGRHRSVAIAEAVGRMLKDGGWQPRVTHRDIDR